MCHDSFETCGRWDACDACDACNAYDACDALGTCGVGGWLSNTLCCVALWSVMVCHCVSTCINVCHARNVAYWCVNGVKTMCRVPHGSVMVCQCVSRTKCGVLVCRCVSHTQEANTWWIHVCIVRTRMTM